MGADFSAQELKRLNLTQLVEHGRQALEAGAYEQATTLLREAVRRAPMRQDLKDWLGMAIEGTMLSGNRSQRRPEPPRAQPRPAAPERPSPPPPRREEPPRAAPRPPAYDNNDDPPTSPEAWNFRQEPPAPPRRPEPREEPAPPAWRPRPVDSEPEPPPQRPRPRFNNPPEDWAEQPHAQPRQDYAQARPEPRPQARPEPRAREDWHDGPRAEAPRARAGREGGWSEPAPAGRYPKPQPATAAHAQRAAGRPAAMRPVDFQRRHQRGPVSAYFFGAVFGLLVSAAVGGIGWLYFQHPEMLSKLQQLKKPSLAELESAAVRARMLAQKGEYAQAYAVLTAFPETPERNARLAALHGDEGDQFLLNTPPSHDRAIKAYQAAIKLDGANPQYRNRLAEVYYQLALAQSADHKAAGASLDQARQTCEAALAQHPDDVDALDILSRVAVQKRDDALLAGTLQRIIEVAPESEAAAKARQTQRDLGLAAAPAKAKTK